MLSAWFILQDLVVVIDFCLSNILFLVFETIYFEKNKVTFIIPAALHEKEKNSLQDHFSDQQETELWLTAALANSSSG